MTVFCDGIFKNDGPDARAKKVSGLGRWYKRGKTPGTQVQHTLAARTTATELRRFLMLESGTVQLPTKFARTFAPLTGFLANLLM
jgi:hypothetical protein